MICDMGVYNFMPNEGDEAYIFQILLGEPTNQKIYRMTFSENRSNIQVANDLREMAMMIEHNVEFKIH